MLTREESSPPVTDTVELKGGVNSSEGAKFYSFFNFGTSDPCFMNDEEN